MWNGGYSVYAFDLTTSRQATMSLVQAAVRSGHYRLQVKFSQALPENIVMFLFPEFDSRVSITKKRVVKCDYLE
jgi:hypothetical protein